MAGRPLTTDEIGHVTNHTRGKYSWLSTKNRRAVLIAIDKGIEVVTFEGLSWKKFRIRKDRRDDDKVYISPTGVAAPFGPSIWLSINRLRQDMKEARNGN